MQKNEYLCFPARVLCVIMRVVFFIWDYLSKKKGQKTDDRDATMVC